MSQQPPRPRDGLTLFRPFGVPVVVAPSWLLVAALLVWVFEPPVRDRLPDLGRGSWLVAAAMAVLLYACVLLHEMCHTATALRLGLPVRRITLHLLGGVSELTRQPQTALRSFAVSVSGPAVNLVLAAVAWLGTQLVTTGTVAEVLLTFLTGANLLIGLFNLLPGLPLDGGRVLEAAVWGAAGRRGTGTRVAAWSGRVVAVLVVLTVVVAPALGGGSPDLLSVVIGTLLGAFIWAGASQSLAAARVQDRLPAVSARGLARRAIPVARDTPVAEALRRAHEHGAGALVVIDADDRPMAVVQESAVRALPEQRRPWVLVADVARRVEPATTLSVELAGEDLLDAVRRRPVPEYLVVDGQGRVYGVLSLADVERVLDRTTPTARPGRELQP